HVGAVGRLAEHTDVIAGAEYIVLARLDHDATHFRMLKAQALHCVIQLDVDPKIIRIELQLIVTETARLIDIHNEIGDVTVALDFPMAIARGIGLVVDCIRHHHMRSSQHNLRSHALLAQTRSGKRLRVHYYASYYHASMSSTTGPFPFVLSGLLPWHYNACYGRAMRNGRTKTDASAPLAKNLTKPAGSRATDAY